MSEAARIKTILAVEDDNAVREALVAIFEDEGYSVVSVESGERALEVLSTVSPDVISLDYNLPGTSGMQLVNAIREKRAAQKPPIILVTAQTTLPQDLKEIVNAVITKPFNITELLNTVQSLLS
jgi:DNA-binding response OmpR family regulator